MAKKNLIIIIVAIIVLVVVGVWFILKPTPEEVLPEEAIPFEPTEPEEPISEVSEELLEVLSRAEDIPSLKYDISVIYPEEELFGKVWQKQGKIRMEVAAEDEEMVTLVNKEKQSAYVYFPTYNMAVEISMAEAEEVLEGSVKQQAAFMLKHNPVIIGSETIEGKNCLIVEYTVEGEKIKTWVWEDYGLPIKTEAVTLQGTVESQAVNIEFVDISDDIFELPAGVEIIE